MRHSAFVAARGMRAATNAAITPKSTTWRRMVGYSCMGRRSWSPARDNAALGEILCQRCNLSAKSNRSGSRSTTTRPSRLTVSVRRRAAPTAACWSRGRAASRHQPAGASPVMPSTTADGHLAFRDDKQARPGGELLRGQAEEAAQVHDGDDRAAQMDDAQYPRRRVRHRRDLADSLDALHRLGGQRTSMSPSRKTMCWATPGPASASGHMPYHPREDPPSGRAPSGQRVAPARPARPGVICPPAVNRSPPNWR